ncbi:hypothetical protein [Pendulispora albinea]|uniref:Porin n=1 Tax=Pendulispora albinea TaxID=2741071 RepID=A0ABZ2LJP6_9BACT
MTASKTQALAQTTSVQTTPAQATSAQTTSTQTTSAQTTPAQTNPAQTKLTQAEPGPSAWPTPIEIPAWTKTLRIGGGTILYWFQPIDLGPKIVELYASLLLNADLGRFAIHIEPRFRDTKHRAFFTSNIWLQEAYVSADLGPATVKVGKVYSRLGLFWDRSFYGNIQLYDGMKTNPNYGVSLESKDPPADRDLAFHYVLQYFLSDGTTNNSLVARDTISLPGGRRLNDFVARVGPFLRLGHGMTLEAAASGEYFQADLPDGTHDVVRGAVDTTLKGDGFELRAEYQHQWGQSVHEFPYRAVPATATSPALPGRFSKNNDYVLVGADLNWWRLTLRYNGSAGFYNDVSVKEWIHAPALAIKPHDNVMVLTEYVIWPRHAPEGTSLVDRSFNLSVQSHF